VALTLLAGCGSERRRAPDATSPRPPAATVTERYPAAGVRLEAPENWFRRAENPPAVFIVASGEVTVSGFAYRRVEPLPQASVELAEARDRLEGEVRRRDPQYRLRSSGTLIVAGAPAIALRGSQVIARRPLEVRSVHVYEGEVEYVFELLAPPSEFRGADRRVFAPLLRSLALRGTIRGKSAGG